MCRTGQQSNTVCPSISEDPSPRGSHFPCWPCIKATAYAENKQKHEEAFARNAAANVARQVAEKEKAEAEKKMREERVRREAREKAEHERLVEEKVKVEREREAERVKKDGGVWMLAEAGSGKKKKGANTNAKGEASPASPRSPGKMPGLKENEKLGEASGRVGVWGPKKILSRKDGAGAFTNVTNAANGGKN